MTSNHGPAPLPEVLAAFQLSGVVTPLPGGQGECFLLTTPSSEKLVLKPTIDPLEADFHCSMQSRLQALQPTAYRIAEPVALQRPVPVNLDNSTTSASSTNTETAPMPQTLLHYTAPDPTQTTPRQYWNATRFLAGHGCPTVRPAELLASSRALHADLLALYNNTPPPIIAARTDRWAWGERYAWSEVPLLDIPDIDLPTLAKLQPYLDRCQALLPRDSLAELARDPDPNVSRAQVIHGDLSGNLLFDDDEHGGARSPPAIIDFSLYHRPVAYAEAIVAADLLLWLKGDVGMLRRLGLLEGTGRLQILVRATVFRIVTFAIQVDEGFVERNLPLMDLEGAVGALEGLLVARAA